MDALGRRIETEAVEHFDARRLSGKLRREGGMFDNDDEMTSADRLQDIQRRLRQISIKLTWISVGVFFLIIEVLAIRYGTF
jgi:hypothetical protein